MLIFIVIGVYFVVYVNRYLSLGVEKWRSGGRHNLFPFAAACCIVSILTYAYLDVRKSASRKTAKLVIKTASEKDAIGWRMVERKE